MIRVRRLDKRYQSLCPHSMNISLTPELEKAVKEKFASGYYKNASEVIREALRTRLLQKRENQWFAREAAIGYAQLEAGRTVEVDSETRFAALV